MKLIFNIFFRNLDPYIGGSIHYIDENFQMISFLVACTPVEGRHTAINVGGHIDKVIQRVAGLQRSTTTFCVSDNAANMLAAIPKHTKKIDHGLKCIDHLIHLIVKATNKAVPEVDTCFKECRDLASRTHYSWVDQQRIQRECHLLKNDLTNPLSVKYRKIITPVETSWNSKLMMIKSVSELRPVLESIREERFEDTDKSDPKFRAVIPSSTSFEVIEQIIPILEKWKMASELLSGDKKPTLHQVIFYNCIQFVTAIQKQTIFKLLTKNTN